jgi:hypothetical protein
MVYFAAVGSSAPAANKGLKPRGAAKICFRSGRFMLSVTLVVTEHIKEPLLKHIFAAPESVIRLFERGRQRLAACSPPNSALPP